MHLIRIGANRSGARGLPPGHTGAPWSVSGSTVETGLSTEAAAHASEKLRERQRRRREASGLPEPLPLLASYDEGCLSAVETLRAKMEQRGQLRLAGQDKIP